MLTKQEFISKIETESRDLLTRSEYDDYRQAQIDDEYYHFTDGRKVMAFLDTVYPIYVSRMEAKELDREYMDYRAKFLKVLSDSSVTDGLVESYRVMKNNVRATQFDGYIKEELKKHKSGENRILKFWNENESVPEYSDKNESVLQYSDENESVLQYITNNNNNESVLHYMDEEVSSLSSAQRSALPMPLSIHSGSLPASCSTDSPKVDQYEEEGEGEPHSIYDGVDWDFSEFDAISPFKNNPIMTAGQLIDHKATVPESWLPNVQRPRLKDGGVECYVKAGTEKVIRQAWESSEWATNPLRTSRKAKSNIEKVVAVTKFIIDWQIRYGKCSISTVRNACGGQDWGLGYVSLIQTPYTIPGNIDEHGKLKEYRIMLLEGGVCKVDDYLWRHDTRTEIVPGKSVIDAYEYTALRCWRQMAGSRLLTRQYENWCQLTKPDVSVVREYIHSLVGKEHKGKEIVSETTVPRPKKGTKEYKSAARKYAWVEEWVEIFERYNCDTEPYFYSSDMDRIYGPYQQLPSCIRARYTYNGKRLAWIDYSSMHPTLILLKYIESCKHLDVPNFDEEVAIIRSILGMDRDVISCPEHNPRKVLLRYAAALGFGDKITDKKIKRYWLVYLNESLSDMKHNPVMWLFKKMLPGFHEWVVRMKKVRDVTEGEGTKTRKNCGYRVTSRWMLNQEARLMEQVIYRIWDAGIFAMLCHDGIDVEQGREEEAMRIFSKTLIEWDLPINITLD